MGKRYEGKKYILAVQNGLESYQRAFLFALIPQFLTCPFFIQRLDTPDHTASDPSLKPSPPATLLRGGPAMSFSPSQPPLPPVGGAELRAKTPEPNAAPLQQYMPPSYEQGMHLHSSLCFSQMYVNICVLIYKHRGFPGDSAVKNQPAMQETQ